MKIAAYRLTAVPGRQTVKPAHRGKVLAVMPGFNTVDVIVEEDTSSPAGARQFMLLSTGSELPAGEGERLEHRGTTQLPGFGPVFHVYEVEEY
jgi:hypothetical protein